jgi:hypothetical protein
LPLAGRGLQGDGRRLQWPQRARLVAIGLRICQKEVPHLRDQHTPVA